jgi:hypothetical protein
VDRRTRRTQRRTEGGIQGGSKTDVLVPALWAATPVGSHSCRQPLLWAATAMGRPVREGVSTDGQKFHAGPPCPTFIRLLYAFYTPKRPYGHLGGGPPAGRAACSRLLPPWIPLPIRACLWAATPASIHPCGQPPLQVSTPEGSHSCRQPPLWVVNPAGGHP